MILTLKFFQKIWIFEKFFEHEVLKISRLGIWKFPNCAVTYPLPGPSAESTEPVGLCPNVKDRWFAWDSWGKMRKFPKLSRNSTTFLLKISMEHRRRYFWSRRSLAIADLRITADKFVWKFGGIKPLKNFRTPSLTVLLDALSGREEPFEPWWLPILNGEFFDLKMEIFTEN